MNLTAFYMAAEPETAGDRSRYFLGESEQHLKKKYGHTPILTPPIFPFPIGY